MLLRDTGGTPLGSGVIVGSAIGGHWLVTNRHVVEAQKAVCVVTSDRRATASVVLAPSPRMPAGRALDLALIWLPRSSAEPLMVAALVQQNLIGEQLPLVVATGFPTQLESREDHAVYKESVGLLLPLIQQPLEGGFDMAYTASVEKGMSGGGLFSGGELIGINGAHANPLWPGRWNDAQGKPVDVVLNEKLDLISLGISASTIQNALKAAQIPSSEALQSLKSVQCKTSQLPPVRGQTR